MADYYLKQLGHLINFPSNQQEFAEEEDHMSENQN